MAEEASYKEKYNLKYSGCIAAAMADIMGTTSIMKDEGYGALAEMYFILKDAAMFGEESAKEARLREIRGVLAFLVRTHRISKKQQASLLILAEEISDQEPWDVDEYEE